MKKQQPARLDRLTLHRETLHLLETTRLDGARRPRHQPRRQLLPGGLLHHHRRFQLLLSTAEHC